MDPKSFRFYTYIRPIIKNEKVRNYTYLAFSIISIIILSFFAIRPTIATIISLRRGLVEQTQILQDLQSKSNDLSLAKSNYLNIPDQTKEKLDALLPQKTDVTTLVKELNNLADLSEASISGLQIQPVEIINLTTPLGEIYTAEEVNFTFNVAGNYPKFINILENSMSSMRLMTISSLSINRSEEGISIMSLNAKSYFLKNQ